ncbi:CHAT domain-containing protein, partial [Multifurca ochricompacta]
MYLTFSFTSTFPSILATTQHTRYGLSDDEEDLDKAILHFTEMVFLPHPWVVSSKNIVQIFFSLASALLHRLAKFKRPEDAKFLIEYLRYLRDQPLEVLDVPRNEVTGFLIELGPDDMMKDIDEVVILCRELLTSDIAAALAPAIITKFSAVNKDRALSQAHLRLPDLQEVSFALAWFLLLRFHETYLNTDCEEAIAILDRITTSPALGDNSESHRDISSIIIAAVAYRRWVTCETPRDLEVTPSLPDRLRRAIDRFLEICGELGSLEGKPPSNLTSFAESSLGRAFSYKWHFENLRGFSSRFRFDDITDIEEAIKYCRTASLAHGTAWWLTRLLLREIGHTYKLKYLDGPIIYQNDFLKMLAAEAFLLPITQDIIQSLFSSSSLLRRRSDHDEVMQLFLVDANDRLTRAPERFHLSCVWAQVARLMDHPSIPFAYDNAMLCMQDTLAFAPTLHIQHSHLASTRDSYETLPLNYASYQIHTGQLERAIETLDQGRALLWSELRGLRTSIDRLTRVDPSLAKKFSGVNRDLEALTMSISPVGGIQMGEGASGQDEGERDPFSRLVEMQRKLVQERKELISQIQALPSFEGFLKVPHFDALRSAASRGPVIIINHCEWRCDILILLHDSPPSLVSTPDGFYDRAIKLKDRLLDTRRKHPLESKQYQRALRSVLKDLYEIVGKPAIEKLRVLEIPEQSRVWLCPTSVLCSLPLHAMGPIPSDDGVKRYFSDLYIPSYTSTLSSLIESRKPAPQTLDRPTILLVAQPDESLLKVWEEMMVIQGLSTEVTTLVGAKATPVAVVDGLRDHRFAHFACHGELKTGEPFDTSFKLYRGKRLTLLDIVTDESIADEGLHLTAAMQYCGFRSVVGTLWEMADTDGRDLAEGFYHSLFVSWEDEKVPYYERSATALRDAVRNLRGKKGIPLNDG